MKGEQESSELRCPYPGLRPFHFDEADLFFGRAEHVNAMLGKLEDSRFLAVVGSSGSGKSSLVRAGLLPALANGFIGGENWRFIVTEPGNCPISNLAVAIHSPEPWSNNASAEALKAGVQPAYTEVTLRRSKYGLVNALKESEGAEAGPVVVLVDQFEELFRYQYEARERDLEQNKSSSDSHSEAIAFVNLLLTAASNSEDGGREIYVIITMRTEYLKDCELFHSLPGAISDSQFLTPPMERSQLIEAIEEPLRSTGAQPGKNLPHHILNDIRSARDQLPLMQHALMRAWILARMKMRKEGNEVLELRSQDYLEGGGVKGAISNHGDEILKGFSTDSLEIVRQIFVSLSQFQDERVVRRPSSVSEIAEIAGVERGVIKKHAAPFLDEACSFLYLRDGEKEPSLDISHEAVTRQWEVFKGWLNRERRSVDRFRYLSDQARRREENHGSGYLLGASEIPGYLKWEKEFGPTDTWAERHGGGFANAISLLRTSFRMQMAIFVLIGLAVVVVFGSIFLIANEKARSAEKEKVLLEESAKREKKWVEEKDKLIAKLADHERNQKNDLSSQLDRAQDRNKELITELLSLREEGIKREEQSKKLETQLTKLIQERVSLEGAGEQAEIIEKKIATIQGDLAQSALFNTEKISQVLENSRTPTFAIRSETKRESNPVVMEWLKSLSPKSTAAMMAVEDRNFVDGIGGNQQAIATLLNQLEPIRFYQLHYNSRLRLLAAIAKTTPNAWSGEMATQARAHFASVLRTHNSSARNSDARIGPASLIQIARTNQSVLERFPDIAGVCLFQDDGDPMKGEPADLTTVRTSDREIDGVFANFPKLVLAGRMDSNDPSRSTYSAYLADLANEKQFPLEIKKGEGPGLWTVSYFGEDWKTTSKEWRQELSAQYGNQVKVYFPMNNLAQKQLAFEVQNTLVRAGLSPIEQAEFKSSGGSDGARVRYFREEDKPVAEKLRNVLVEVHGLKNCETRKATDPDADPYSFHVFLAPDDSVSVMEGAWVGSGDEEATKLLGRIAVWNEIETVTVDNLSSVLKKFQRLRLIPETGEADDATLAELRSVVRELRY